MANLVDYASPSAVAPRPRRHLAPIFLVSLTALAVYTCVRIEVQNALAGNYLPTRGTGKWRWSLDGMPGAKENNALHETVAGLGLWQYPLTFLLLVAIPIAVVKCDSRRWRVALVVAWSFVIACMALMFYRGYFTSLGW